MKAIGYHEERQHWDVFDIKVSSIQAKIIVDKLARHFKLSITNVVFYGWKDSGQASRWRARIRLCHTPSIGVICHEVNHFLCWKKFGVSGVRHGTKTWCRQLQIIINYVRKMNFWNDEFARRTAPKPQKPEPTKLEIRLKKIERLENNIKRHNTRIKRCQTLIKKTNRKISALKRFI
ncbi:MAG: hypothetical protein KKF56_05260 [Nanoarchaeota archaeon]|nr:hypothetical protein [Nanoarchaeota archaeon]